MNKSPQLSIIVPVYNTEDYLPRCIESILAQTFKDFELLIVDDGSTDSSGDICDKYAKSDSRIVVIHQENAGVSSARNAALDIAKGEYIGFVDSDDFVKPELYEKLVGILEKTDSDVSICGLERYDISYKHIGVQVVEDGYYSNKELINCMLETPNPITGNIYNKCYRSSAINSIRFITCLKYTEDWTFLFEVLKNCKKGVSINKTFYCIVESEDSATRANEIDACFKIIISWRVSYLSILKDNKFSLNLKRKAVNKYLDDCVRYGRQIKTLARKKNLNCFYKIQSIRLAMIKLMCSAVISHKLSVRDFVRYVYMLKI